MKSGINMKRTIKIINLKLFLLFFLIASYSIYADSLCVPKNIIYMICDGCGFNHITITNYYLGVDKQPYENFPIRYAVSTYPAQAGDYPNNLIWETGYNSDSAVNSFEYLMYNFTESAAAGTALATGIKVYNHSIGYTIDGKKLYNLTEFAKDKKKSAGVVTTVQWSHATPASFIAHNRKRTNYKEIALEMLLDSKMDVIIGAGHPYYDDDGVLKNKPNYEYVGGKETWYDLKGCKTAYTLHSPSGNNKVQDCDGDKIPDAWTLIEDKEDFITLAEGHTPVRVCGTVKVFSTLQEARSQMHINIPFKAPQNASLPTLSDLVRSALNVLDNNPNGFFLMVEGGAVDWASHINHSARLIEEMIDFNDAVNTIIKWIEKNGGWEKNLLIITADHETGYITGPKLNDNNPNTNPIIDKGKGNIPEFRFNSNDHTNSLVPFFAKGCGCEIYNSVPFQMDKIWGKYIDNTDIPKGIFHIWK